MSETIQLQEERSSQVHNWTYKTGEPVHLLNGRERKYVAQVIDIRKFNQPRDKWLRNLIRKFKVNFNGNIGKFVNERAGKVISTMDLQNEFDGHFLIEDKPV